MHTGLRVQFTAAEHTFMKSCKNDKVVTATVGHIIDILMIA